MLYGVMGLLGDVALFIEMSFGLFLSALFSSPSLSYFLLLYPTVRPLCL